MLTNEGLVLLARCEGSIGCLVAKVKLGGLGHCMHVGTPNIFDSVPNGCVDGEWYITENTLCRSHPDSVGCTATRAATTRAHRGRHRHGRGRAELSHAFWRQVELVTVTRVQEEKLTLDTAVVAAIVPAHGARAIRTSNVRTRPGRAGVRGGRRVYGGRRRHGRGCGHRHRHGGRGSSRGTVSTINYRTVS
jgi:hypothetical protein